MQVYTSNKRDSSHNIPRVSGMIDIRNLGEVIDQAAGYVTKPSLLDLGLFAHADTAACKVCQIGVSVVLRLASLIQNIGPRSSKCRRPPAGVPAGSAGHHACAFALTSQAVSQHIVCERTDLVIPETTDQ